MPLQGFDGEDIAHLEAAVASVEKARGQVTQVVGNIAGRWWLLVEKAKPAARETRGAAK
jgi:hypothetical protein